MNNVFKIIFVFYLIFSPLKSLGQADINYDINANLNLDDEIVFISQTITYKNIPKVTIKAA